jgi:hypothetical protein
MKNETRYSPLLHVIEVYVQLSGHKKFNFFILIELAPAVEGCEGMQLYKYITSHVLL